MPYSEVFFKKKKEFQPVWTRLTPNEHPPWAPEEGTLDTEGLMPGVPVGKRPKAFRFKPGIRLD